MSPSWADQITLTLLSDRAFLRRQPHGARRAMGETLVVRSETSELSDLTAAIQKAVAERSSWQRATKLTVVLGNTRVHYAALPWVDDFMRREERLSYARIAMNKQFGSAAENWDIRLSEADYGDPWLAAGVDRTLLGELTTLAEACHWRLVSVQPALMTVANEFRLRLAHGAIRLLLLERGRAVVARLDDGRWRQVRMRRLDSLNADALERLISQEVLLDPDEAWDTTRLCVWAFDAPGELRAGWRSLQAEVLENPDVHGLLAQRI